MKGKKILAAALGTVMAATTLIPLAGCGKKGGPTDFEFFLGTGEKSEYYTYYQDNPSVQYWLSKTFESGIDKDAEGNPAQKNLSIKFNIPVSGAAGDNLNNMLKPGGDYPEIVDPGQGTITIQEAYESGIIFDLTDYINECMPNYKARLKEYNAEMLVTTEIDGQRKNLQLVSFQDIDKTSVFCGYMYRRDWIIKYGEKADGSKFTGEYTLNTDGTAAHVAMADYNPATVNGDSWVDDITFPSWEQRNNTDTANGGMKWYADWCAENDKVWDGTDPITISDWEWMFEIFEKAIATEKLSSGYEFSMYYPGYIENGDLATGFGGGGISWYKDKDGSLKFGATEDRFKYYLECMNAWWKKGWIDKEFSDRTNDVFYKVNDDLVRRGEVGMWMGNVSELGSRIYNADYNALKNGVVVSAAAQPINDKYGTAAQKGEVPDCFFASQNVGGGLWITDKAKKKDIKLLLHAIDYLYSEEGSKLVTLGLSKEQLEEAPDSAKKFYSRYGLENGAYTEVQKDGKTYYQRVPKLETQTELQTPVSLSRLGFWLHKSMLTYDFVETYDNMLNQYILYNNSAFWGGLIPFEYTRDESRKQGKIYTRINEYLTSAVPLFIKGTKTINNDWATFCSDLNKRECQYNCEITNKYLEALGLIKH